MPASKQHDEAVLEAEFDQGIEHRRRAPPGRSGQSQQPAPMAPFMISVLSRNAPLLTTFWPGFRPQVTSSDVAAVGGLGRDPLRPVDAFAFGEEDDVDVVLPLHGLLRDDHGLVLGRRSGSSPRRTGWPGAGRSGCPSSARTRVVRVCSLTSVPTQVTWPTVA